MERPFDKIDIRDLLTTIYTAGFELGSCEGASPEHETLDAFGRLLKDESPRENGHYHAVKTRAGAIFSKSPDDKKGFTSLLYTIYVAGFNHGVNEGPFPKHGLLEAFDRLVIGESPTLDNWSYKIKDRVEKMMSQFPDDTTKKATE